MKFRPSILIDWLHIFVLVGFAVAQPLYDILGQNSEFFVAHKAGPTLILAVVLVLTVGLPVVLIALELVAFLMGERVRRSVHWIIVFLLAILAIMPTVKQMVTGPDVIVIGIGFVVATVLVTLYARFRPIQMFLSVLSPAAVIFPLWFLLFTPINGLLIPQDIRVHGDLEVENPAPVVVVVLDEFSLTALLDRAGKIDSVRFPNFAEFAGESWWFPNAMAVTQYTSVALPAIVSGFQPPSGSPYPPPTAANYPQTLFTMLGDHYHFNVIESMATLCPDSLCKKERDVIGSRWPMAFSDILVIYLHLLAPPDLSQDLPPLDAQWVGFGKKKGMKPSPLKDQKADSPPKEQINIWTERDLLLEKFLTKIEKSHQTTLHFMHVLLPHVPYEFLASGHRYLLPDGVKPAGIKDDLKGWIGGEPLILTAYYRYLQQIGYLDRFLGKLRSSLKTANFYDDALIILTADHGVAFREKVPRRVIKKENAVDILRIPMFVKLPGQREGKISQRLVSSVDILPTIIDVLQVNTSWDLDGFSMYGEEVSSRTRIEVPGVGDFNEKDLNEPSSLKWQFDHFQEHTSLADPVPQGPFPSFVGQAVSNFSIGKTSAMRAFLSDLKSFEHVNPDSGYLPALFVANILKSTNQNLPIAVALNGRIWATTQTVPWNGKDNYLSVLLPSTAFKRWRNLVEVYVIDEKGKTLIPIPLTVPQQNVTLKLDNSGQLNLRYADGREVLVEGAPKTLRGHIDRVSSSRNMLIIDGWAADLVVPQPAERLLIFSGEELVSQVKPKNSRPGKVLGLKGTVNSGFRAQIPLDLLKSIEGKTRAIVVSQGPRASPLDFTDEQKSFIQMLLLKNTIRLQRGIFGQLALQYSDGSELLLEESPKTLRGHIDRVSSSRNMLFIDGWAADLVVPQPAERLLIFSGEQLVSLIKPNLRRPDVVTALKQEGLLNSGFHVVIPLQLFKSIKEETRVIVLSKGPRAVHLPFFSNQKKFISSVLEKKRNLMTE